MKGVKRMKISQIGVMNYNARNLSARKNNENEPPKTETQPNFKGLWGKGSVIDNTDYDSFSGSETTTRHYYPFSDKNIIWN